MEKMQILFPEPQLMKLRRISRIEDRPVSELVRAAVDFWLSRRGNRDENFIEEKPPVYGCGVIISDPGSLREMAWEDRWKA